MLLKFLTQFFEYPPKIISMQDIIKHFTPKNFFQNFSKVINSTFF